MPDANLTPAVCDAGATTPRIRQVVVVTRRLQPAAEQAERELGLAAPYHDPEIAPFGLENVVYSIGESFLEIVSPVEAGTAAERYLERGGDGGYMAIFQVADVMAARRPVDELGIRTIWELDAPDMVSVQLHPKDVPGAIVTLDCPQPAQSWRWGGPRWSGDAVERRPGGITRVTVAVPAPNEVASRWATVLGVRSSDANAIVVGGGTQRIQFVGCAPGSRGGISEVAVTLPETEPTLGQRTIEIAGVRFTVAGDSSGRGADL